MAWQKITLEITATIVDERFRFQNGNGDVVICDVDHVDGERPSAMSSYTIKGPDDESRPIARQRTYRFYGRWAVYKNKRTGKGERQFHFTTFIEAEPASRGGVITYLREAGRGNGIGQATAAKIWERFGSDSVRIFRESPDVVAAAVPRLSVDSAAVVAAVLDERKQVEHCSIELMGLLDRRGFPKITARRAIAIWGNQAADLIKRNPYLLMRFRGCGWKGADRFYLDLGLPPGRLKRQSLCGWYSIASDTSGHTWYPRGVAYQGITDGLAGRTAEVRKVDAIRLATRAGMLEQIKTDRSGRINDNGDLVYLAESKAARSERFIARELVAAESEPIAWPDPATIDGIDEHQANRLAGSLTGVIGVFGGGPGTGKTYTAAALIKAICNDHAADQVAVAAPTGKAAVRMTEALQSYGINQRAKTIHSLLGVETSTDGWSFRHNEGNPLELRFLVVDESSMIDADLMSSLLAARARGTHILFVGDVCQLPPVGHGAPLRDFIRAGLPFGELTEIKRNDGGIVEACADIRAGRPFKCQGNLVHKQATTPKDQIANCLAVCQHAQDSGLDPVWDVQIVVPVNRKSPVSRQALNLVLQEQLNHNAGVKGSPFRQGDKIVNTANGFYPVVDSDDGGEESQTNGRGEVYTANGELAEVLQSAERFTVARLTNPSRTIRIPRGNQADNGKADDDSAAPSTGCNWDLGYALSVHKSQGSEWPTVAVVIDECPGAKMVCSREWIYTAFSRAKRECVVIGKLDTARRFCKRTQINERKTFLVELVAKEQAARILAEL